MLNLWLPYVFVTTGSFKAYLDFGMTPYLSDMSMSTSIARLFENVAKMLLIIWLVWRAYLMLSMHADLSSVLQALKAWTVTRGASSTL